MLDQLKIAKYRFVLKVLDTLYLPAYKGGVLRGAFGTAFKRMACQAGGRCKNCQYPEACAYSYVFETPVPPGSEVLRNHQNVPHPFVIEPPQDGRQRYRPGETLSFDLVLVGNGIPYLSYFILAFKLLAEEGIGPKRGRFQLDQVWALDPLGPWQTLIYDGPSDALRNDQIVIGPTEIQKVSETLPLEMIRINFDTPTRLKHQGAYVKQPDFHILARALLRRISTLYYFHCGERWETDYPALVKQAQTVKIVEANTQWITWERFSSRQGRRVKLDGITGSMTYQGNLSPFRELLTMGSLLHVGKACTFGWGKYSLNHIVANLGPFKTKNDLR